MSANLLYSENPKMPRNRPFLFALCVILNISGIILAFRFEQQSLQITGLVIFLKQPGVQYGIWMEDIITIII